MADGVDSSLLSRLQALRASSATPELPALSISVDVIERAETPTREDALAARLKRLRDRDGLSSSPSSAISSPAKKNSPTDVKPHLRNRHPPNDETPSPSQQQRGLSDDDDNTDAEALFRTDDDTLEELLGGDLDDQPPGHVAAPQPPGDDEVKALLEELAAAIPTDGEEGPKDRDSDDSDGEQMTKETDDVIARFQDELELDTALGQGEPQDAPQSRGNDEEEQDLPSLPSTITTPPTAATPRDDIAARMAVLRASSSSPSPSFPSVPTSRTAYTDDDVDSWCTVCLADATLRCLGCDHDPYCSRCWWEMHLGPSAGFDEHSHKAIQFTGKREREKEKIALGAS
ncbi:hypothetical protein HRG_001270 [Hirsutella rhossiliensis]|uniref:Uncharacterized protein n=1 Tax=Hirsutella rhossiliensis TaxID=111463 RepID=A0A9P8SMI5_9HYPO|nr:uncharacterized protein HRG_01270 [Hirsutella rhossiliensis]KAH0968628.1 hypothetical protein HRG_01270 [Hirsutella rhossiliensis]